MYNREELADALLQGCPNESRQDHEAIARAIVEGVAWSKVLNMPEVIRWPETYSWLRSNTVGTLHGKPVYFDAAIALMDDDLRERLHYQLPPRTEQEFLDAYCAAHLAKFGTPFIVA